MSSYYVQVSSPETPRHIMHTRHSNLITSILSDAVPFSTHSRNEAAQSRADLYPLLQSWNSDATAACAASPRNVVYNNLSDTYPTERTSGHGAIPRTWFTRADRSQGNVWLLVLCGMLGVEVYNIL